MANKEIRDLSLISSLSLGDLLEVQAALDNASYHATIQQVVDTVAAEISGSLVLSGLAPPGGTTNQVLTKQSGVDYDYAWEAQEAGGAGDVSVDGTPDNNQITVWTNSDTVSGYSELTWNELSGLLTVDGDVTITGDLNVTDDAYAPDWDGDTGVPTKNAIYDRFESLGVGSGLDEAANETITGQWSFSDRIDADGGISLNGGNSFFQEGLNLSYNPTTNIGQIVPWNGSGYGDLQILGNGNVTLQAGTGTAIGNWTFTSHVNVPNDAYAGDWNGSTEVPTKDAIYDVIESLGSGGSGVVASLEGITYVTTYGGAVGDGVENDTVEINATITAAVLAGGGLVRVPEGDYLISAPITLGENVTLEIMQGARIFSNTDHNMIELVQGSTLTGDGIIENTLSTFSSALVDFTVNNLAGSIDRGSRHTNVTGNLLLRGPSWNNSTLETEGSAGLKLKTTGSNDEFAYINWCYFSGFNIAGVSYGIHLISDGTANVKFINGNVFERIGTEYLLNHVRIEQSESANNAVKANYFYGINCQTTDRNDPLERLLYCEGDSNMFDIYGWDWDQERAGSLAIEFGYNAKGNHVKTNIPRNQIYDPATDSNIIETLNAQTTTVTRPLGMASGNGYWPTDADGGANSDNIAAYVEERGWTVTTSGWTHSGDIYDVFRPDTNNSPAVVATEANAQSDDADLVIVITPDSPISSLYGIGLHFDVSRQAFGIKCEIDVGSGYEDAFEARSNGKFNTYFQPYYLLLQNVEKIRLTLSAFWRPGRSYLNGDIVGYNEERWRCIADHTNQTPGSGSAYWTKIDGIYGLSMGLEKIYIQGAHNIDAGHYWLDRTGADGGMLGNLPLVQVTTADLANTSHNINTVNKAAGALAYNTSTSKVVSATGPNPSDSWVELTTGSSGDVATDSIWSTSGDLAVGSGSNSATRLARGSAGQYLRSTGSNIEWAYDTNIFNVKNFGAVGDGTTDDTAAIQAAIDAAETAGGGTVLFPVGEYITSASLSIPRNITVSLRGERGSAIDTIINMSTGSGAIIAPTTSETQSLTYWSVSDLTLDSRGNTNCTAGIDLEAQTSANAYRWCQFDRLYIWGNNNSGSKGINCEFAVVSSFRDVVIRQWDYGFYMDQGADGITQKSSQLYFYTCEANDCNTAGFRIDKGAVRCRMYNCRVEQNLVTPGTYGYYLTGNRGTQYKNDDHMLIGCETEDEFTGSDFYFEDLFMTNMIGGGAGTNTDGDGIHLDNCKEVHITNVALNDYTSGTPLRLSSNCEGCRVTGNSRSGSIVNNSPKNNYIRLSIGQNAFQSDGDVFDVRSFGAVGDGTTDDTAAIQAAITAANGATVYFPHTEDSYYIANEIVLDVSHDVVLVGDNAKITYPRSGDLSVFDIKNSAWSSEVSVTSIDTNVTDWPSATSPAVMRINGSGTPFSSVKVGDLVMLIQKTGSGAIGAGGSTYSTWPTEQFKVVDVESGGASIVVSGTPMDAFDNAGSPTETLVLRYQTGTSKVVVEGFTFEADDPDNVFDYTTYGADRPNYVFRLYGHQYSTMRNCHFNRCWAGAVAVYGEWAPDMELTYHNLPDDSVALGYGFAIFGSTSYGSFRVNGSRCRHAITVSSVTNTTYSSSNYRNYGFPKFNTIRDSISHDCTNATYDVHQAFETTFVNCESHFQRNSTGSSAWQSQRGNCMTLKNCKSVNSSQGLRLLGQYDWVDSDGNVRRSKYKLIGFDFQEDGNDFGAAFIGTNEAHQDDGSGNSVIDIEAIGCHIEGYAALACLGSSNNMDVRFMNCYIAENAFTVFRWAGTGKLGIYNTTIDYKRGGAVDVVDISNAAANLELEIDNLELVGVGGTTPSYILDNTLGGTVSFKRGRIVSTFDMPVFNGTAPTITPFEGDDNEFNVKHYGAVGDGTTDDTAAIQAAINACNAAGGGEVLCPAPNWYNITDTLDVLGEVNLVIQRGAAIYMNADLDILDLYDGCMVTGGGELRRPVGTGAALSYRTAHIRCYANGIRRFRAETGTLVKDIQLVGRGTQQGTGIYLWADYEDSAATTNSAVGWVTFDNICVSFVQNVILATCNENSSKTYESWVNANTFSNMHITGFMNFFMTEMNGGSDDHAISGNLFNNIGMQCGSGMATYTNSEEGGIGARIALLRAANGNTAGGAAQNRFTNMHIWDWPGSDDGIAIQSDSTNLNRQGANIFQINSGATPLITGIDFTSPREVLEVGGYRFGEAQSQIINIDPTTSETNTDFYCLPGTRIYAIEVLNAATGGTNPTIDLEIMNETGAVTVYNELPVDSAGRYTTASSGYTVPITATSADRFLRVRAGSSAATGGTVTLIIHFYLEYL